MSIPKLSKFELDDKEEHVKLRTDTIGHFEQPTEKNIRAAILYPDEGAVENDIVKLMIDDANFLCVWIGKRTLGHLIEWRSDGKKVTCKQRLDSETAILMMVQYFHGDFSWSNNYTWEKSKSEQFLEDLQKFVK